MKKSSMDARNRIIAKLAARKAEQDAAQSKASESIYKLGQQRIEERATNSFQRRQAAQEAKEKRDAELAGLTKEELELRKARDKHHKHRQQVEKMIQSLAGNEKLEASLEIFGDRFTNQYDHAGLVIPDEVRPLLNLYPVVKEYIQLNEPERRELRDQLNEQLSKAMPPLSGNIPKPRDFQYHAVCMGVYHLVHKVGGILVAGTGAGKTYAIGYTLKLMQEYFSHLYDFENSIIAYIAPKSVVKTARSVISAKYGVKRLLTMSYDDITTGKKYDLFVTKRMTLDSNGAPCESYAWKPEYKPAIAIFDECQYLKNASSSRSQICAAYALPTWDESGDKIIIPPGVAIGVSATPFSRMIHTYFATCVIRPPLDPDDNLFDPAFYQGRDMETVERNRFSDVNFNQFVKNIAAATSTPINEWTPRSMNKIKEIFEPYTIRMDRIKYKHTCRIHQVIIPLPENKAADYRAAYDRYEEAIASMSNHEKTNFAKILTELRKHMQAADAIRSEELAILADDKVKEGKNVIIAVQFLDTLDLIYQYLTDVHGYESRDIAIIRGGQSEDVRNLEMERFQTERAKICLMVFTAGGVGINLHHYHADEFKNHRPRVVFLPPVYNAEEMVQVLGRAHRENSESVTEQYIIWYQGTVEEKVALKLAKKSMSLSIIAGRNETWVKELVPDDEVALNEEQQLKLFMDEKEQEDEGAAEDFSDLPVESTGEAEYVTLN